MDSIGAYDLPARVASYDADMDIMHPNRAKMVEVSLDLLPFGGGEAVTALELGVGTGYFTARFLARYPHGRVIGIEGARSMVELARARLGSQADRVDFRVGDFRRLDALVAEDRGHAVLSSYALHHLDRADKERVVHHSLAFLEPGGWFLNADLIVASDPEVERRIQHLRVEGIVRRARGDERFGSVDSTRAFLDELEANEGDQPLTLQEDLDVLRRAGLARAATCWAEYREAVTGGVRG